MSDDLAAAPEAPAVDSAPAPEAPSAPTPPSPAELSATSKGDVSSALDKVLADEPSETITDDTPPETTEKTERARDEKGRFTKAEGGEAGEAPAEPEASKPEAAPEPVTPRERLLNDPEAVKAWAETPEPVRREVEKRIDELEAGIGQYQEQMADVKQYVDFAKQQGGSLKDLLDAYSTTENNFRQAFASQPAETFFSLGERLGFDPVDAAYRIIEAAESGKTLQMQQPQSQQQPASHREQQLEAELAQMREQIENQAIERDLAAFRSEHPDFEQIEAQVYEELALMKAANLLGDKRLDNLKKAYERAKRFVPAATPEPTQPPQARPLPAANQQITGAPVNGSPPSRSKQPAPNTRSAVSSALDQIGLR